MKAAFSELSLAVTVLALSITSSSCSYLTNFNRQYAWDNSCHKFAFISRENRKLQDMGGRKEKAAIHNKEILSIVSMFHATAQTASKFTLRRLNFISTQHSFEAILADRRTLITYQFRKWLSNDELSVIATVVCLF